MGELQIRKLDQKDTCAYRQIRLLSLKEHPDLFGTTWMEESAKTKLPFERYLNLKTVAHFMFGAFIDGRLIGIAGLKRGNREKTQHKAEVVQLYIERQFKNKGIGHRLLKCLLQESFLNLQGIEEVKLGVVSNNIAAKKLYVGLGFVTYALEENCFKDKNRYYHQDFMHLTKEKFLTLFKVDPSS